jgi:two-component system CheB/CheR fusion protein
LCHYTLNKDGILFLGTSEAIGEFTDLFQPVDSKWKIFKRKDVFMERSVDYPGMPPYLGEKIQDIDDKKLPTEPDIFNIAKNVILEKFALPGVLINKKYEIVHFMGKTDKFLETPTGRASFNILSMAREGLRLKLNAAIHNAVRHHRTISFDSLRIKYNGEFRTVDLTVTPLTELAGMKGYLLVIFDDKTPAKKIIKNRGEKVSKDKSDPLVVNLQRELEATKEHLQTTIEEMDTSNEELKSTNEELQSVNEELQSTNEELETSKEELQSTNEELVTVNTELQNKVDELYRTNNDINNLLASTRIAPLFLDTHLNIKRFTPAATDIFNLIQTDLDRPISDITSKIRYDHFKNDSQYVLDTLAVKEVEVQDTDNNWYTMRISPYRTTEYAIEECGHYPCGCNETKTRGGKFAAFGSRGQRLQRRHHRSGF